MTTYEIADPAASESVVFLSIAERDRRYAVIRDQMRANNIDVLVLPATTNRWERSLADSRYVSGIGGFQTETLTIFPLEGEVTCYLFNRSAYWKKSQQWVQDIRDGRNDWGANIVERVSELQLSSGTIALSQLSGISRTPGGVFPHGAYEKVRDSFPKAKLVSASQMMADIRSDKSLEEVAALKAAALITDKMAQAVIDTARPGIRERQVYAAIVHAALSAGSEQPALLIYGSGPPATARPFFVPSGRVLSQGDLVTGEFEARVAGYASRMTAPVSVGPTIGAYQEAMDVAKAAYMEYLPELKPGATLGGLRTKFQEIVTRVSDGRFASEGPAMDSQGLGGDLPSNVRLTKDFDQHEKFVMRRNMVVSLTPHIHSTDGSIDAAFGRTVHITDNGAVLLNQLDLSLAIAE